jgi:hypothetical protein
MDLEQLTKHQTLLLTLLVSFVTSIATGIVTVSLMDQAPEGVTRVINQIVERTVETVVPANQGAAVATERTGPITRGVVVDANGLATVDSAALSATNPRDLEAILYSGERVPFEVVGDNSGLGITFINLELSTSTGFVPATLVDPSTLTLGQTVLRIGGAGGDTVAEGVIAAIPGAEIVEASVTSATPGSVLLTIFGEVIGIATPSLGPANDMYTVIVLPEASPVTNPA